MSSAARWSLAALLVVVALVVAMWPRAETDEAGSGQRGGATSSNEQSSVDDAELARLRTDAGLADCPQSEEGSVPGAALAGVSVSCLADGSSVDLASALAGKPAIVNLWAYWCAPCAEELPYLQQFSERAADAVTVLTVHTDPNEAAALSRLTDYGVTLPGVQDARAQVRSAVGAPPVLPVSVLVRADGTVAQILPQPFASVDEIAALVETHLGVAV